MVMKHYSPVQWCGIKNEDKFVVSSSVLNSLFLMYYFYSYSGISQDSLRRQSERTSLANHIVGAVSTICQDLDDWTLMEKLDSNIQESSR